MRLSDLTDVATEPKPIERQRVETALKVFSENTAAALATNPQLTDTEDTVIFIRKVLRFWKIFNVKTEGLDRRFNDPLRAAISDPNDERLDMLLEFGEMISKMGGPKVSLHLFSCKFILLFTLSL